MTVDEAVLAAPMCRLSRREHECLKWAARGKTFSEMGMILGISFGTVKTHLDHARYKLNCATLQQTTAVAVALGILTPDDLRGGRYGARP
jgi:LuxR family transcriptional activator of conjugal transfer of Ti plasmids